MGLNPIKHCAKFEVCNYVMKYWVFVVYKHLIEICMKTMGLCLGKVGCLCL